MNTYKVYLLLGSNMGNREEVLNEANIELIERLLPDYLEVASLEDAVATSNVLESEPWGFESPDKFLNQAFACITNLEPEQVLVACLDIEKDLGRVRSGEQFNDNGERVYQSRVIDIDILLIEKLVGDKWELVKVNKPNLIVPHARLKERDFAMKPLKELYKGKF